MEQGSFAQPPFLAEEQLEGGAGGGAGHYAHLPTLPALGVHPCGCAVTEEGIFLCPHHAQAGAFYQGHHGLPS